MLSNLLNLAICVEFFVVFTANLTNASPTEIDHKSETLDVNIEAMVEDAINWAHIHGLIEVNIGQIGGLFNAPCITDLHRRTMAHAGLDTSNVFMPINEPDAMVVDALIMAWKAFGDKDAIKIPTIAQGLAGQKKIQQVLALPGMVERFFPSSNEADTVATIRKTFAGMWGLDDPEDEATKSIIQNAIDHPDKYVMKPCREGGGNNFFGEKIPQKLREFSPAELGAHILMQKLTPLAVPNFLVRPLQDVQFENVVSELGIFGFLLGNVHTKSVQHNVQRGHYLRSKLQEAQEGGIYGGEGVVDSPLLF
uniref:ATP-grasp domain-containing protein n=1 Tax=Globodera pallida TaxID=36090 RepID=A0A183BIY3_GLOPA